jgi:hypothetical protein
LPRFTLARKGFAELVETTSPQMPIPLYPSIEVHKGFGAERIEALLALGPDTHESRLLQDTEMPRYAGLVDVDALHNGIDRMLTAPKDFDYPESGRIG